MPIRDRAAQFASFAALTGYAEKIKEIARITEEKPEMCEDTREILDRRINELYELSEKSQIVSIMHFVKDERKNGGSIERTEGTLYKIDKDNKVLILSDGVKINIDDIVSID